MSNEEKCINNIKRAKQILDKNGEISPSGFNYKEQLEYMINLYEVVMKKNFDRSLLEKF